MGKKWSREIYALKIVAAKRVTSVCQPYTVIAYLLSTLMVEDDSTVWKKQPKRSSRKY
jgi:hypothetical protein